MALSKTVSGAEFQSGYADRPDHKITIEPVTGKFSVYADGIAILETDRALILREGAYPPVYYFPRDVIHMAALRRTEHTTWCPFKGRAAYFSAGDDPASENVAWSYEDPFEEVAGIKDHIAFYSNKVALAVIE